MAGRGSPDINPRKVSERSAVQIASPITPEDLAAVLKVLIGPAAVVDARMARGSATGQKASAE